VPRYPLLSAISLKKANARQECLQASPEWFTANVCANIDRVLSLSGRRDEKNCCCLSGWLDFLQSLTHALQAE
jgi:hypothetical protein